MKFAKLNMAAAVFCLVSAIACGDSSKPLAEAAIKTATDAYAPVSAEAQKYVPDQARKVQDAIASAQAAATKGDYKAALDEAKAIPAKVTDLSAAIAAKKTELAKSWTDLSASVPSLVGALKSRVEMLSKSKGVPAGLTKDTVEQAKSGFAAASAEWNDAMAAAKSGDFATATSKGSDVKMKVIAIMTSLKMQVPKSGT